MVCGRRSPGEAQHERDLIARCGQHAHAQPVFSGNRATSVVVNPSRSKKATARASASGVGMGVRTGGAVMVGWYFYDELGKQKPPYLDFVHSFPEGLKKVQNVSAGQM